MSSATVEKKIWTILDILSWGTSYLNERGFEESRLTIELLLSHVLKCQRIQLYTNFDRPLSPEELSVLKEYLKRRLTREPLQYILGETEFMGLKFSVNNKVLIPRPETELLVEFVINQSKQRFAEEEKIFILDCGTGSGCIAVSLAAIIPNSFVVALDNSEGALETAKRNAEKNSVSGKIDFILSDIHSFNTEKKFHYIVSNPPYVSDSEYELLPAEIKQFEPRAALFAKNNGLQFYPLLAGIAKNNVLHGGCIIAEHQFNQSEHVQKIFTENGMSIVSAIKDYDGNFRHVAAEMR